MRGRLRPSAIAGVIAVAVAVAVVIAVGRWERGHYASGQAAHLRSLYEAVGGTVAARSLSAYRLGPPDCFWYEDGGRPYAISLCFDRTGRLVEGSDRRSGQPRYWSVQPLPSAATVHVDAHAISRLVVRLQRVVVTASGVNPK